jgi:methionine-rich copper-binding protein CopC
MVRKNIRQILGFLSLMGLISVAASPAGAHAQLVSAEPAADATVAAPETIVLHFNEPLEVRLSSFRLTDIDGNPVAITVAAAPDPNSLAAKPDMPLAPGLYTVSWTVAGPDAHPMQGTISFTVK